MRDDVSALRMGVNQILGHRPFMLHGKNHGVNLLVNSPAETSGQTPRRRADGPDGRALQKQTRPAARGGLVKQIRHHHPEFFFMGQPDTGGGGAADIMNDVAGLVFIPPAHRLHLNAQACQFAHQGFDQRLRSAMGQEKRQRVGKKRLHGYGSKIGWAWVFIMWRWQAWLNFSPNFGSTIQDLFSPYPSGTQGRKMNFL